MRILGTANWYLPAWLQWLPRWSVEGTPDVGVAPRDEGPAGIGSRTPAYRAGAAYAPHGPATEVARPEA
jgi:hypothetical protein